MNTIRKYQLTKSELEQALRANYSGRAAAKALGISRATFYRLAKQHGIAMPGISGRVVYKHHHTKESIEQALLRNGACVRKTCAELKMNRSWFDRKAYDLGVNVRQFKESLYEKAMTEHGTLKAACAALGLNERCVRAELKRWDIEAHARSAAESAHLRQRVNHHYQSSDKYELVRLPGGTL